MSIAETLLPDFDHEMATTRRLLSCVPESGFAWKPHDRSRSLGELSGHLATIPAWGCRILDATSFDLEAAGADIAPKMPASHAAMLAEFDRLVAQVRATLSRSTDAELLAPWRLERDGEEFFTVPRVSALRTWVVNHSIHHRGQLSVYLRQLDVRLPPIYGPTADEP